MSKPVAHLPSKVFWVLATVFYLYIGDLNEKLVTAEAEGFNLVAVKCRILVS